MNACTTMRACLCVCACVCVRACACACVCVCARARVRVRLQEPKSVVEACDKALGLDPKCALAHTHSRTLVRARELTRADARQRRPPPWPMEFIVRLKSDPTARFDQAMACFDQAMVCFDLTVSRVRGPEARRARV